MSVAPVASRKRRRLWLFLLLIPAACLLIVPTCQKGPPKPSATITYSEIDGQNLSMDVYLPSKTPEKPRPAVLLVHGGGWEAGKREDLAPMGQWLANNGYVGFSVSYRLVTETGNKWPAQLNDVQRAIRWIRANSETYQIDPDRVGAVGASAGGHLVACLGTMDPLDNSDPALAAFSTRPNCIIDLCGPTDLTEDYRPKVARGEWVNGIVDRLLGSPDRPGAHEASPLFSIDDKTPPFLIVHGDKDDIVPLDHSQRFDAALRAAGIESKLVVMKGGHSFTNKLQIIEFAARAGSFLKTHLK